MGEFIHISLMDEKIKVMLNFMNACLNMEHLSTYISRRVLGWLLYMEQGNHIN